MAPKMIYAIITLLYCSVCAESTLGPGNFYFGNYMDWKLAWETCHNNQTRLPNIQVSESGFQLAELIHWNSNECFWIGATYERTTNYTYGSYPTVCCGTITKKNNKFVYACENCETVLQFLCESGPDTVSDYVPRSRYLPWINASKACTDMNLQLPAVNNTSFLGRVQDSVWWINEARIINLSPTAAKDGDIPICFCGVESLNSECSANVETLCMPYTIHITTTVTPQQTNSRKPITSVTSISPGNFYFGNHIDWDSAWKTCRYRLKRLPSIQLSETGLQLADIIQWSPSDCFWIGATYDRITDYSYVTYPTVCCGTITRKDNDFVYSCVNCETSLPFVCESGPNTVSDYVPRSQFLPWINASKECTDMNLGLPSVNNTFFLGRVQYTVWWINEARILNLSSMAAKNDSIPLCFCGGESLNNQCSSNVKTVCMP